MELEGTTYIPVVTEYRYYSQDPTELPSVSVVDSDHASHDEFFADVPIYSGVVVFERTADGVRPVTQSETIEKVSSTHSSVEWAADMNTEGLSYFHSTDPSRRPSEFALTYEAYVLDGDGTPLAGVGTEMVFPISAIEDPLKSPSDRYLAALQAMTTTGTELGYVPDEYQQQIKEVAASGDIVESASMARELASKVDAKDFNKVPHQRVRKSLLTYANHIDHLAETTDLESKLDTAGTTVDFIELVLSISEQNVYSNARVERLTKIQAYAQSSDDVTLPDGMHEAIDRIESQVDSDSPQTMFLLQQYVKNNPLTATSLGTSFGSFLLTSTSTGASLSSSVTAFATSHGISVSAAGAAATTAAAGLSGMALGNAIAGAHSSYMHAQKARYLRRSHEHFSEVRRSLEKTNFHEGSSNLQYDTSSQYGSALYFEFKTMEEYYNQEILSIQSATFLDSEESDGLVQAFQDFAGNDYSEEIQHLSNQRAKATLDVNHVNGSRATSLASAEPEIGSSVPRPTLESPSAGATAVSTGVSLSWTDVGADQYDVRLEAGDSTPDETVRTGLDSSTTTISPQLSAGTTYYWQVVAVGANGDTAVSEVRSFTTSEASESPGPTVSGPSSGIETVPYSFTARAQDDADQLYYVFEWGDGTETRFPSSGTVRSDVEATVNHVWASQGTYTVEVQTVAEDGTSSSVTSTEIDVGEATVSDRVYAGRELKQELDLTQDPPYSSYRVGDYRIETISIWDGAARLDIYKDGEKRYDGERVDTDELTEFFGGDLMILPHSLSEFGESGVEFYYVATRTDPSVVTVTPSEPVVEQGGTVDIELEFPPVSNPDEGVCGPESYLFGDASDWVSQDSDWIESIDTRGDGYEVDADCDEFSDGDAVTKITVPEDAPTGEHELDIVFDSGKDAVYRMDGIEIEVRAGNSLPDTPESPTPTDGAVEVGASPTLDWTGSDPDGDSLTYTIKLEKGDTSPEEVLVSGLSDSSHSLDSLDLEPGATYYWQVEATDEQGAVAKSPVWSFETKVPAPQASLVATPKSGFTGMQVTLYASVSTNPAGSDSQLSYSWEVLSRPDGANVSTPTGKTASVLLETPGEYTYQVAVSNGATTSTATTTVRVAQKPNAKPTADAGTDRSVVGGTTARLNGTDSTDSDGQSLSYEWTQLSGVNVSIAAPGSASTSVTVPEVAERQTLIFELTVTDDDGATAVDTVAIVATPESVATTTPSDDEDTGDMTETTHTDHSSATETAGSGAEGDAGTGADSSDDNGVEAPTVPEDVPSTDEIPGFGIQPAVVGLLAFILLVRRRRVRE
ncbi:PKD domain-containing protein [Haloarchaeobius sp. TZWSO28]|uniref:PKD domain-containing protein n=1 Tax=Haloarchaeobius sp. TZWSO28 TaxID=3446119 RepID=UPI003EB92B1A